MDSLRLALYFAFAFIELGCQTVLFLSLSEGKYSEKRTAITAALFVMAAAVLCAQTGRVRIYVGIVEFPLAVMALPSLIFFCVVSRHRGLRLLTTFCIANVSLAIIDLLAYLASIVLFPGCQAAAWSVRCLVCVALTLAMRILITEKYHRALLALEKGWGLQIVIAVIMYVIMWSVIYYPRHITARMADVPIAMLFTLMLELFMVLMLRIVYTTLEAQEREGRAEQLEFRLREAERQYSILSSTVSEIRRVRHDMKYHMNTMGAMLDAGDYDGLRAYFADYRKTLAPLEGELPVYSKNQTVNVLAAYYRELAMAAGTEFELELNVPEKLGVDDVHLTVLVGNMWQNALEACRALPFGRRRYIKTRMLTENGALIVKCVNSALETVENDAGAFLSTKDKSRGLGLGSVREIAELYSGSVRCEMRGGEFVFAAMLPMQTE